MNAKESLTKFLKSVFNGPSFEELFEFIGEQPDGIDHKLLAGLVWLRTGVIIPIILWDSVFENISVWYHRETGEVRWDI